MKIGLKKDISGLAKDAWHKGYFNPNITAKDLEDVFHVGNVGPEEQIEVELSGHPVRDIVEDENGKMSRL